MIFAILDHMNVLPLIEAYRRATKRLLLLDYDGTLVGFHDDPMAAVPRPELLETLRSLANDPKNTVVVISGRPAAQLDMWLGHLPLSFSAEHGFLHKKTDGEWHPSSAFSDDWRQPVRDLMDHYVHRLPGTIVEEKASALTWHWRAAEQPALAAEAEQALLSELEELARHMKLRILRILRGNKVIEVHPQGFDKGTGGTYWLKQETFDFVLAIGDDTTDEDLFKAMPETAFTIKVGIGHSAARLRLEDPKAVLDLLYSLSNAKTSVKYNAKGGSHDR